MYLVQLLAGSRIVLWLGLVPYVAWSKAHVWQFVTYMFLHGNLLHLAFNMYALWVFGREVEEAWGRKAFLRFYAMTGIGAGLIHTLVTPHSLVPTIGASGAVMGVLTAFAILYPERDITLLLFFFIPVQMKARTMVLLFGCLSLIGGIQGSPDGVAHIAHLGGMLVGWLYLKRGFLLPSASPWKIRWKWKAAQKKRDERNRIEDTVNQILDKANAVGMNRLSWKERRLLEKASKRLRKQP